MEKAEVIELIESLSGNEKTWVDFKQDYEIGGIEKRKAEFIKDVSSIANSLEDRSDGYLLVGVDDDGNIVGIDESRIEYRGEGPRHIISFDESDIQQILDGYLDPLPDVSWSTYDHSGAKIGVLAIAPGNSRPIFINRDLNDSNGNQLLHEGRIYVRKGTSKEIAKHTEIQNIIDWRVQHRRDEILEGITKAIEVGPEAITRFRGLIQEGEGEDALPLSIEDDAEYTFQERVSRDPASNLDSYLNSDIVNWAHRNAGFIEPAPLWKFYARSDELTLDEEALYFLTQCAIDNHLMGLFWLEKSEAPKQILLESEYSFNKVAFAAKALVALGEKDALEKLISKSSRQKIGEVEEWSRKVGYVEHNRIDYLLESEEHFLKHGDWSREFKPKEMNATEAKSEIPALANKLHEIQKIMDDNYGSGVGRRDKFRSALWDLELVIGLDMG